VTADTGKLRLHITPHPTNSNMRYWPFPILGKTYDRQNCSERQERLLVSPSLQHDSEKRLDPRVVQSNDFFRDDAFSLKTVSRGCVLVVACMIAGCLCFLQTSTDWSIAGLVTEVVTSAKPLAKHAAATTSPLLQVFQVYPPVLTTFPRNGLEITDGSTDATVALVNDNVSHCEETLIVHSFANSYGQPFVGPCLCICARVSCRPLMGARNVRAAFLHFQSCDVEFDRRLCGPAVRSLGYSVSWRYRGSSYKYCRAHFKRN